MKYLSDMLNALLAILNFFFTLWVVAPLFLAVIIVEILWFWTKKAFYGIEAYLSTPKIANLPEGPIHWDYDKPPTTWKYKDY